MYLVWLQLHHCTIAPYAYVLATFTQYTRNSPDEIPERDVFNLRRHRTRALEMWCGGTVPSTPEISLLTADNLLEA